MQPNNHEFSEDQWNFLAVLDAFGGPLSMEVAGAFVPLLPGPLFDMINRAKALGWIEQPGTDRFALTGNLPATARKKLQSINTRDRLGQMADTVLMQNFDQQIKPRNLLNLLEMAGRHLEASQFEIELAYGAVEKDHHEEAAKLLRKAIDRLCDNGIVAQAGELFISAALAYSSLCFTLGSGFQNIDKFLGEAHELANQTGDRRSLALINFHLGRLYYFLDRRDEALVALSLGIEEIKELGDDDIISQSSVFIGIFYFIKGCFKEAIAHFDKAEQFFESKRYGILNNPRAPIFIGYCAAYLGQFHRAIGCLDFNWRLARERNDKVHSSTIRAVLGTVLLLLKKKRKAAFHLQHASEEAKSSNNTLGSYFAGGGIALMHFIEGRFEKAHAVLMKTIIEGTRGGLVRQFASPWILEMLYEFDRLGFEPIPGFGYLKIQKRIWDGVNIHLQGVALRLRAKGKMADGDDNESILADLAESKNCLIEAGDPVQLSKTILEIARIEFSAGNKKAARTLTSKARRILGGYAEELFPHEFKHLIDEPNDDSEPKSLQKGFFTRYLDMIESLYPSENREEILSKILLATNRMFGAERSGLFLSSSEKTPVPKLTTASSLSRQEVDSESFLPSLKTVIKAFRTGEPVSCTLTLHESVLGKKAIRSVLCIPVEVRNKVRGVLYYDNSYLDDAFDFLDSATMKRMMRHLSLVVERRVNFLKVMEERHLLASEKNIRQEVDRYEIISESVAMVENLALADRVSKAESNILISGETGTGKELMARRLHRKSLRSKGPFIVVDSTTIPADLLESELFGHEKGAFTGADQRKIGRIELAHHGTLFLDEVGELPLSAQAKLLRALQEKTFHRVGGTRTIKSNFRLVAATNRNLSEEVATRRFRQDLYFRLNVIPIHLPPLRKRGKDILVLADHFLKNYAHKYKKNEPVLTAEQKKALLEYQWPGNIRELKNIMERAILLSGDERLAINLPAELERSSGNPFAGNPSLQEIQRRYIRHVLDKTNGKVSGPGGACEILGMKRTSLYSRMKALGLR